MTAALPLDDQLCFALYAANIAINRVYKPMLDAMGITYPQYLVLHTLWERDGRTVGMIADRLMLESSTVTPPIKRLEAAGYVERRRDRADERRVQVWLTGAGARLRERCGCLTEHVLHLTGMTQQQLQLLNQQIQDLCTTLRRAPADQ